MPNLVAPRKNFTPFASQSQSSEVAIFGSTLNGGQQYTTDSEQIQSLSAWLRGWYGATFAGQDSTQVPTIEEFNGLFKVLSDAIFYQIQKPIPEYLSTTEYFINSLCSNNGIIYISLVNNNINQALPVYPIASNPNWAIFYDRSNVVLRDGTANMLADLDMNFNKITNLAQPTNPNDAVRFTDLPIANAKAFSVNKGKSDATTSQPNFALRNTATELIFLGLAKPIEMTYADNTVFKIIADETYNTSLLADGTYVMLIENGVKTPVLLSKINEGIVLPLSGTAGDYFVVTNPLETYKWNTLTTTWDIVKIVRLCEFVIALGVLNANVINYAFNREAESDWISVSANNQYTYNDNLGCSLEHKTVSGTLKVNLAATEGVEIPCKGLNGTGAGYGTQLSKTNKTVKIWIDTAGPFPYQGGDSPQAGPIVVSSSTTGIVKIIIKSTY
jgi:hypothetical protein